jgi:hypothetical protein
VGTESVPILRAVTGEAEMGQVDPGGSKFLLLAADDMRQAATGARFLQELWAETEPRGHLIHVVETGVVVAYVRPFTKSDAYKRLKRGDVPREWRALHNELWDLRRQLYAHTDAHPNRDASVTKSIGGHAFEIFTVSLPPGRLLEIITLCDEQAARFQSRADALGATPGTVHPG